MLLKKRILAALVDYLVIVIYATSLFGITMAITPLKEHPEPTNPINGQIIGFFSLTLPVFLYFFLMESGKLKASLGKLATKIRVASKQGSVLKRTILKFLPWEMAHVGVHWMVYYSNTNSHVPLWVWIVLILPQLLAILYFGSIIYSRGSSSIYDKLSKTNIVLKL